jgi:hypothetical protein
MYVWFNWIWYNSHAPQSKYIHWERFVQTIDFLDSTESSSFTTVLKAHTKYIIHIVQIHNYLHNITYIIHKASPDLPNPTGYEINRKTRFRMWAKVINVVWVKVTLNVKFNEKNVKFCRKLRNFVQNWKFCGKMWNFAENWEISRKIVFSRIQNARKLRIFRGK